jgi:hypothetical protein
MTRLPAEVQTQIKSYLELAPGVDVTSANLKTLLVYTLGFGYYTSDDALCISIAPQKRKRQSVLSARMEVMARSCYRPCLCTREFPASEDGLLEALVYLKAAVKKYRTEGVCEACKEDYHLRLKADGMPQCERCVLNAAVGL